LLADEISTEVKVRNRASSGGFLVAADHVSGGVPEPRRDLDRPHTFRARLF